MGGEPKPNVPLPRPGDGGFTLIEALIAFVVLALVTVTLQRGVIEARGGLMRAASRVGSESVLRTLMTGPLGPDVLAAGRLSGVLAGYAWTMTVKPLDLALSSAESAAPTAGWAPVRLKIEVDEKKGRRSVEVIRLAKSAP